MSGFYDEINAGPFFFLGNMLLNLLLRDESKGLVVLKYLSDLDCNNFCFLCARSKCHVFVCFVSLLGSCKGTWKVLSSDTSFKFGGRLHTVKFQEDQFRCF